MRWLGLILLALLIAYLIAALLLYIKQRDLLYFPSAPVAHSYETLTLTNQGEQIAITVTNPGKEKALLYWGGNGEAVAAGAAIFEKELPDYSTYLVDYRGYGRSTGIPTEEGILSDALALYDYIRTKHQSISLFGRSLGTGVACYVASQREAKKLILITPYDSIESVARDRYWMFPLSLLVKDKYDSLSCAPEIKSEILILIAEHDTVVPKRHAYTLSAAFPASRITVEEIPGSHHNDIADTVAYHQLLDHFLHEER
jgi:pimeloyl-ACP methyl ester carboxylesterase